MKPKTAYLPVISIILSLCFPLAPVAQEVLRGEVRIELEPVYGGYVEDTYPLETGEVYRRALEAASLFFSAQIYGWSFYYHIGERARGIAEEFTLTPLGQIHWGDPGLRVTHANIHNNIFSAWMDYRPNDSQRRRLEMWRMGNVRTAQAHGFGPLGVIAFFLPDLYGDNANWLSARMEALEDSARAAIRAMLQGDERNRPKEASGFISLQNFPAFWMDSGRMVASARFRVEIREIIPFAVH